MNDLEFPRQVRFRAITHETAEKNYTAPTHLSFIVHGNPAIRGNTLIVSSELRNDGEEFHLIVNPYGGKFPYGGTSPFNVFFSESSEVKIRYQGPPVPPEPPLPMEILVPAKTKILFPSEISLDQYSWAGTPEVKLNWSFHYFREPYPKGTVKVVLPEK